MSYQVSDVDFEGDILRGALRCDQVFSSDQGLVSVFEEQLPEVEHKFCLMHLYANFKKKFGGGTLIRDLMMAAAKCTYLEAWEEKMLELKKGKRKKTCAARKLELKPVRFSNRIKSSKQYVGPGSDPKAPLLIEDDHRPVKSIDEITNSLTQ